MPMSAQYLKTEGQNIIDPQGNEIILRGLGLGGWMLQEGYMMQSSDVADTQHEFRNRLVDLIGVDRTDEFYQAWLDNHVTKADIDSLAAWGYNSVRLPMHYNLFTLPIEDEPVAGENTWLDRGFEMVDELLLWCEANEIYLILDLHAAPGGQGANAAISDYDPSKPSLWESEENKQKTVALWKKLAERYTEKQWIGGYDLINEVNWDLPGGVDLRDLYVRITDAIREVDQNHIIYIEGNDWANNFTGLQPAWDDNMVYSFHKYWSYNDQGSIGWVLQLQEEENVPLWMGEGGENSNVWFNDAISLFERNNIGWSFWPMKRVETVVGPYSIPFTDGYKKVLSYWRGEGPKPTEDEAYQYMMELALSTNSQNCIYNRDVADAQVRQVDTDAPKPYAYNEIPGVLNLTDYDMGKNNITYYDIDVANYSLSTGEFSAWNSGWFYRNDGVDIEVSENTIDSNGFHVGFTNTGEWMKYTVTILEEGIYRISSRVSSGGDGGKFHLELNGNAVSTVVETPGTGDWQEFTEVVTEGIILPQGKHELAFYIDQEGFNIANIAFEKTGEISDAELLSIDGEVITQDGGLKVVFSQPIQLPNLDDLKLGLNTELNGESIALESISLQENDLRVLFLNYTETFFSDDIIAIDFSGELTAISGKVLNEFNITELRNTLDYIAKLPGKIEAEDFDLMEGFQFETTADSGGGQNLSYSNPGDYTEYYVYNQVAGDFDISGRFASQYGNAQASMYLVDDQGAKTKIATFDIPDTGGWQTWSSIKDAISLPEGFVRLRFEADLGEFNTNYFLVEYRDSDQDGIADYLDQCPDSSPGAIIDVNGCEVYSLPASNFTVSTNDETCIGSQNGKFEISTALSQDYQISITGANNYSGEFTDSFKLEQLVTGSYSACITVDGQDYEYCFDFVVNSPDIMTVNSSVNQDNGIMTINLQGGDRFVIEHNGRKTTAVGNLASIQLKNGNNSVRVFSDGGCQEEVLDTFFVLNQPVVYPVPFGNKDLNINFQSDFKGGWVRIYNVLGVELYEKFIPASRNHIKISNNLFKEDDLYIVKVTYENNQVFTYKVKR